MVESVLGIIFSAENARMLVVMAFVSVGYALMKGQMKDLKYSLKSETADSFHAKLKSNDFTHLNSTIEALTLAV